MPGSRRTSIHPPRTAVRLRLLPASVAMVVAVALLGAPALAHGHDRSTESSARSTRPAADTVTQRRTSAHAAASIPWRALGWLGKQVAKQIGRRTRQIVMYQGRQAAIDYYCRRWLYAMGSFENWYYWAWRDWRANASWRFCSRFWH